MNVIIINYELKAAIFLLQLFEQLIEIKEYKTNKFAESGFLNELIYSKMNFELILKQIKKNIPSIYPIISFYHNLYRAMNEPDNYKYYQTAKKIFVKELRGVTKSYKLKLYSYMINYNIILVNKDDDRKTFAELFSLIINKLNDKLFEDLGEELFYVSQFRDYIIIALKLKKYKWVEDFVETYSKLFPENVRDDYFNLGKALLYYQKRNFKLSAEYAGKVSKANPFSYVDIARIHLISNFEIGNYSECVDEIKRVSEYIRRKKKVPEHLTSYTGLFVRSFSLLLKFKENPTKKNLQNLEYDLSKGDQGGRNWIREKIKELNKILL